MNTVASDAQLSCVSAVALGVGLPRELDYFLQFLGGLESFQCGSNPWLEPPAAVLGNSGNIATIRSYFVDLYREKRVVSRSLKVVLVGREDTGKTRCSILLQVLEIASPHNLTQGHGSTTC